MRCVIMFYATCICWKSRIQYPSKSQELNPKYKIIFFICFVRLTDLGKIPQHFRHFVAAFAATNVNDHVAVGILGQWLRDDRFSTAKSTWNCSRASLNTPGQCRVNVSNNIKTWKRSATLDSREKCIQNSLSGQQWMVCRELLGDWPDLPDRPHLHHGELVLYTFELQLQHHILNITQPKI